MVQRQVLYLGEIKTLSARCGVSRSSALIVKPEGFPLAYEVLAGNTSDKTTLRDFLKRSKHNTVTISQASRGNTCFLEEKRTEVLNLKNARFLGNKR